MRVCVDLGTAFSKATAFVGEQGRGASTVAPLPLGLMSGAEHPLLTPSALYVDGEQILFGPAAIERVKETGPAKRLPLLSFKMFLSAKDLDQLLTMKLSRQFDPSTTLSCRDAITLYLAYLDQLVRAAVASDPAIPPGAADAPRRITSPLWRSGGDAQVTVGQLVAEAGAVSEQIGADILKREGVSFATAKAALEKGLAQPASGCFESVVFEAQSAAAAYTAFAATRDRFVLVVDMGAGTTDLAAFERDIQSATPTMREITEARRWSTLAGDELDSIIRELFLNHVRDSGAEGEARLWRSLRLAMLRLKQDLFSRHEASFEHERKRIVVKRNALLRDPAFKDFRRALTKAIADSLAPVAARAKQARESRVAILLAGGGSGLPFLAELVEAAAKTAAPGLKVRIERFGANWSLPYCHHPLAGAFPQLAISIGGAIAAIDEQETRPAEAV